MKRIAIPVCLWALAVVGPSALAWGPHPQITAAAQEVVPERDQAEAYFGKEWKRLQDYCMMPDMRGSTRNDFFPDDFLIFPAMPRHVGHMMPDVPQTYRPYFLRAVQALRTETPQNAARWIGSLLHFVEDTGAPPHAAAIGGEMHKRLENWLDAKAITIAGYKPRLLGRDESSALAALMKRMDGLVEYSKERTAKCQDHVKALADREDQPLILECANESARVCADVMHTLFTIVPLKPSKQPAVAGRVAWPKDVPLPGHPAKVVVLGASYSTLTDTNGAWELRNVSLGRRKLAVSRIGAGTVIGAATSVTLPPGDPPGNLVRNADFRVCWVTNSAPDCWRAITSPKELQGWESDNIRVSSNLVYRVGIADARPGVKIGVRWRSSAALMSGSTNVVWSAEAGERELQPIKTASSAQVLVLTDKPLATAAGRVWLAPAPSNPSK
ncbi:MAG: hypothetical protein FJ388_10900 [Verrucomicrobia bacterium]|nr:hypothetical protein [Verrucomicrobiota bacterium]